MQKEKWIEKSRKQREVRRCQDKVGREVTSVRHGLGRRGPASSRGHHKEGAGLGVCPASDGVPSVLQVGLTESEIDT